MGEPAMIFETDMLDEAVERAVAAAGGDLRMALRALAIRQHELENVIATTVSAGYVRRRLAFA